MTFREFREIKQKRPHHSKAADDPIQRMFSMDAPYDKGVEDGQSRRYDPPTPQSQIGMNRKYSYLLGWLNTHSPDAVVPERINHIPNKNDKLFFIQQRREHNYSSRHQSNMVHHKIGQDKEYDDDITRSML